MSQTNDGGPAFPLSRSHFAQDGKMLSVDWTPGMSLRDWFAGQALLGITSHDHDPGEPFARRAKRRAESAYTYADAMLKARDGT